MLCKNEPKIRQFARVIAIYVISRPPPVNNEPSLMKYKGKGPRDWDFVAFQGGQAKSVDAKRGGATNISQLPNFPNIHKIHFFLFLRHFGHIFLVLGGRKFFDAS